MEDYYWKADFELAEYQDRQTRVREAMTAAGIDLLLVVNPVNLNWLIGFRGKSYQEFQMLFFPLEPGPLTVVTRLAETYEFRDQSLAEEVIGWGGREPEDPIDVFAEVMREHGWLGRRVGLEVPDYYLHPLHYERIKAFLGAALALDASLLVHDLKLVKSPAEIAYIRKSHEICDAGMRVAVEEIVDGRTELAVSGRVTAAMMELGSDFPASPMNFASGERTCYGHALPSERRLRAGDLMHLEFGASYRRYAATIARQLCLGRPTPRMREIYQVARDACDACIAAVKSGVSCRIPHLAAAKVIAEAGMNDYRLHTTGYGIAPGFPPSWGELIHFMSDSPYALERGMVLSVEPPVFIHEERLGARIIDNVLVTEHGCEILSRFSRDLIML